ncbi:MAG TPA: ParB/Srx family N-terminal domain-containing protein [bacterium]|nr:ParB/Srx family N-terminal domain-containing protein [bacterium]
MMHECEFQMLPIENVHLDFENPRIKQFTEMYGDDLTHEQIYLALNISTGAEGASFTTFHSLEQSIRTHGRIIHPILVNKEVDGKLVVIEGNTRAAIYKSFLEKGYQGGWDTIPAMVHERLDQAEIDAIRLQSHLVGPRPWDPYSKAKYLHYLRNAEHLTMAQVVDYCGGRRSEVQTYLAAYEDMEAYYRANLGSDDEFDASRFSAFVELQRPNVKRAILRAGFDSSDFARWVIEKQIFPLSTVRMLPQILANKRATEIFLSDGAREAIKVIDAPISDEVIRDASLEALAREVIRRVRSMPYSELNLLREEPEGSRVLALMEARDELEVLCQDIVSDEQI